MASNLTQQIKDQIDGQTKQNNELIIKKESEKFMEIFDRVFSENENENEVKSFNLDSEDGIVEDIFMLIVKKVKSLIKQKFINDVLLKEDGENDSSSETEA